MYILQPVSLATTNCSKKWWVRSLSFDYNYHNQNRHRVAIEIT